MQNFGFGLLLVGSLCNEAKQHEVGGNTAQNGQGVGEEMVLLFPLKVDHLPLSLRVRFGVAFCMVPASAFFEVGPAKGSFLFCFVFLSTVLVGFFVLFSWHALQAQDDSPFPTVQAHLNVHQL